MDVALWVLAWVVAGACTVWSMIELLHRWYDEPRQIDWGAAAAFGIIWPGTAIMLAIHAAFVLEWEKRALGAEERIRRAIDELGVPDETYPAPVLRAREILQGFWDDHLPHLRKQAKQG